VPGSAYQAFKSAGRRTRPQERSRSLESQRQFQTFRDGAIRKGEGVVVRKLDALKMARSTGDIPQNLNFAIKGSIARDFMAKHGVTAVIAPSTTDLPAADVAERTQFYTALIECWK